MILVVYLGHGIFHPVAILVLVKIDQLFGRGLKRAPKLRGSLKKKSGAPQS